jgi:hypothetical protein
LIENKLYENRLLMGQSPCTKNEGAVKNVIYFLKEKYWTNIFMITSIAVQFDLSSTGIVVHTLHTLHVYRTEKNCNCFEQERLIFVLPITVISAIS